MRFVRTGLLATLCLLLCATALADGPRGVRKRAEASMLVTGMIEVDEQGKVSSYALDQQDKLPAGVVDLLGKSVPGWVFAPVLVDGNPVKAKTDMSIRVVVHKREDGNYEVEQRGVSFGTTSRDPAERAVAAPALTPPDYPPQAARLGLEGSVYLLLKVGRDGKVEDVIAEQVNLGFVASDNDMVVYRKMFAKPAIAHARTWTFNPPTRGEEKDALFWTVRVPVVFNMGRTVSRYGQWSAYIPGPRQRASWEEADEGVAFSPDALPAGGAFQTDARWRLLSLGG
ncbi:energy transducer TonB [Lysobacter fragariae]